MPGLRRPARELAPAGPLGLLDRAFSLAREAGMEALVPSWIGGGLFASSLLGAYYVERVEGITTLRPLLALGVVLAWCLRVYLLGRAARRVTRGLWDAEPPADAGRAVDVTRSALVVGMGLWCWAWLLVAGGLAGALGVVLVLPFFALRGAVAPSWIARSACTSQGGWRVLLGALHDQSGQRVSGVLTESMFLLGALGLTFNLFMTTGAVVLLLRSFAGLEIAAVESFLSPSNTFVLLAVAASGLVLLEPVRAAHSAAAYVGARVRADGLDLRASLEEAIAHAHGAPGEKRPETLAVRAAAVAAAAIVLSSAIALAQDVPPPPDFNLPPQEELQLEVPPVPEVFAQPSAPGPLPILEIEPRDASIQDDVGRILARSEFREFEDDRGEGLRDLIERVLTWLFQNRDAPSIDAPTFPRIGLPGPWVFIALGAALLLAVAAYLLIARRRAEGEAAERHVLAASSADLRDRAPTSFLEEAAALAHSGELRGALRSLYLATLVSLDRRRWIAFDPHLTNWQYSRQIPRGMIRDRFGSFTRLFDHKWYGEEPTTLSDYEHCRELALEIVDQEGPAA